MRKKTAAVLILSLLTSLLLPPAVYSRSENSTRIDAYIVEFSGTVEVMPSTLGSDQQGGEIATGEWHKGQQVATGEWHKGQQVATGEWHKGQQVATGEWHKGQQVATGEWHKGQQVATGEWHKGQQVATGEWHKGQQVATGEWHKGQQVATGEWHKGQQVATGQWHAVSRDMHLKEGDLIRVEDGSSCRIEIEGIGVVDVGGYAEIEVSQLAQMRTTVKSNTAMFKKDKTQNNVELGLRRGSLSARIKKKTKAKNNVRIVTPLSLADVKGTTFSLALVESDKSEERFLLQAAVLEGSVQLKDPSGEGWSRVLGEGTAIAIVDGAVPGEPVAASDEVLQKLTVFSEEAEQAIQEGAPRRKKNDLIGETGDPGNSSGLASDLIQVAAPDAGEDESAEFISPFPNADARTEIGRALTEFLRAYEMKSTSGVIAWISDDFVSADNRGNRSTRAELASSLPMEFRVFDDVTFDVIVSTIRRETSDRYVAEGNVNQRLVSSRRGDEILREGATVTMTWVRGFNGEWRLALWEGAALFGFADSLSGDVYIPEPVTSVGGIPVAGVGYLVKNSGDEGTITAIDVTGGTAPSFSTSSVIEYWSSDRTITSNYTIPAGHTVSVLPGVRITLVSAAIRIDGEFIADRATFTGNGSPTVDATVHYRSGSTGQITNSSFTSLADGIRVDGGSVTVAGSTFTNCSDNGLDLLSGVLTVSSSTISGSGTSGIKITGGSFTTDASTTISSNSANGVDISGGSLTVSGSTITGNTLDGILATGGTINVQSSATISSNSSDGIHLNGGGILTVDNSTITGNSVHGINRDATTTVTVTGTTISNHTASGSRAIKTDNSGNITVTSSTFSGNHAGIEVDAAGAPTLTVSGAAITGSTTDAINIASGTLNVTGSSSLTNSGGDGIDVTGAATTVNITGGTISGSGNFGIRISQATVTATSGLSITGNTQGGIRAATSANVTLTGVSVNSNSTFGLFIQSSSRVTANTGCSFNSNPSGNRFFSGTTLIAQGSSFNSNGAHGLRHQGALTINGGPACHFNSNTGNGLTHEGTGGAIVGANFKDNTQFGVEGNNGSSTSCDGCYFSGNTSGASTDMQSVTNTSGTENP